MDCSCFKCGSKENLICRECLPTFMLEGMDLYRKLERSFREELLAEKAAKAKEKEN